MSRPILICVDDQRDVLATLIHDLAPFAPFCDIEECESAAEAKELLEGLALRGEVAAVVLSDHIMPGKNGIDFLADVARDPRFATVRKVLVTGLATHQDTIRAINESAIDHYIEKPWQVANLVSVVKVQLTRHLIAAGLDYQDLIPVIDAPTLYAQLSRTS